jgi:hypothetical protein
LLTGMTGNSLHMQWPLTSQFVSGCFRQWRFVFRKNREPTYVHYIFPSPVLTRGISKALPFCERL